MSELSNLDQIDITGKKVFLRVDFNVPLIEGKIISDIRILEAIPTIKLILSKGAAVIIGSHLGRPKGKIIPELSILPIANILKQHLQLPNVMVASDVIGESAISLSTKLLPGDVMFIENLRFESGEETNDAEMAKVLASMADVFVNDAFSCSHRAHSSVLGITSFLPSVAGLSMQKEIDMLNKVLKKPIKPVTAIVGGSKISTKLAILEHLIEKVDHMIIGGAMANTFLFANGYSVGKSLFESDMLETARNILKEAQLKSCSIWLPKDAVVAEGLENKEGIETVDVERVPEEKMILDIGPRTSRVISRVFSQSKTLLWNGPLGVFETKPFDTGTILAAKSVANLTNKGSLISVAGGGDTLAALDMAGVVEDFSHVSTGGGAFLEWLKGDLLPGIEALITNRSFDI